MNLQAFLDAATSGSAPRSRNVRRTPRPTRGSAEPWKNTVSARQCRPGSGWAAEGATGRRRCAAHGRWRRPGSESGPPTAKVRSGSRRHPGRGKGGCSPSRYDEPWRRREYERVWDECSSVLLGRFRSLFTCWVLPSGTGTTWRVLCFQQVLYVCHSDATNGNLLEIHKFGGNMLFLKIWNHHESKSDMISPKKSLG